MPEYAELRETAAHLEAAGYLAGPEHLLVREGDDLVRLTRDGQVNRQPLSETAAGKDDAAWLAGVLLSCPDNSVLLLSKSLYTRIAASGSRKILPVLDDMAQLVGPALKIRERGRKPLRMRKNSAILLADEGALCAAVNLYEVQALAMVVEKSCLASFGSQLLGSHHPIPWIESRLMRFIYTSKYSKAAKKGK